MNEILKTLIEYPLLAVFLIATLFLGIAHLRLGTRSL